MSSVIDSIERDQLKKGLPSFEPGDRVKVHFQVIEGTRKRTQVFEGVVLRRQGNGARETRATAGSTAVYESAVRRLKSLLCQDLCGFPAFSGDSPRSPGQRGLPTGMAWPRVG